MNKRDYLVKTFSRTKRKDYENYILTAIWHKLDNMNLKPVSQQYVKRQNGTYALMDLYFPQLHIGVEVDEAYHQKNQKEDKLRMDDIISAVNEDSINDFQCLRIDATKSLEEINDSINEIVSVIQDEASKSILEWKTYEEELKQLKQQEYLTIYDAISFMDIKDIANTVFGKNAKRYQRSYFRVKNKMWLWCPKLSITENGDTKSVAGGWLNLLAEDWSYIDESHQDGGIVKARSGNYMVEVESGRERAVFAKYKDNLGFNRYRFVGIFKVSGISPKNGSFIRYLRVSDKVEIVS
ncbi:AbaSI family restriction endonuclease [Pseudogracilibacillus sp. SO30301A]|uniref:AbaSI family restriction endonuclease n=1 Tax=Pseudogracilibacillus sp. SO30301A TaxID=3098291 RepID=UPI00300DCDDE